MDLKQLASALGQISEEKGIPKEKVLETVEIALAAAYKKEYGEKGQIVRAKFDQKTGEAEFFQVKIVVDESMLKPEDEEEEIASPAAIESEEGEKKVKFNAERHIMIDDAKKIKKDIAVGDEMEFPLEAREDFGRIAAQTAKQVIIQRIREAEREAVWNEYKDKESELISGIIQRIEPYNIFIDLGRTVAVLPKEEQVFGERYPVGSRMKFYILAVNSDPRGPGIVLSRSHPKMISRLFELEVPEIGAGTVEIKSIAREAGSRTKIAVASNEEGVDPIGSCVGQKGTRVAAVISEIGGEKIDIIEWSEDPEVFISNSISPAKAIKIESEPSHHSAKVFVPEDQLSLAIGKAGQNVRLAAKLTGWKIDIVGAGANLADLEGKVSAEGKPESSEEIEKESAEEKKAIKEGAEAAEEEMAAEAEDEDKAEGVYRSEEQQAGYETEPSPEKEIDEELKPREYA